MSRSEGGGMTPAVSAVYRLMCEIAEEEKKETITRGELAGKVARLQQYSMEAGKKAFEGETAESAINNCLQILWDPERYSIYLLYWYKSTTTDADGAARFGKRRAPVIARVEYGVYKLLEFARPPYTPRGEYASTTAKEELSSAAAALLACAGDLAASGRDLTLQHTLARQNADVALGGEHSLRLASLEKACTSQPRPEHVLSSLDPVPVVQGLQGLQQRLAVDMADYSGGCVRDLQALQALQVLPLAAQHLWGAAEQNSDRVSMPESPCAGAARGSSAIEDRDSCQPRVRQISQGSGRCHLPDPWLPLPEFWLAEAAPQGPANNPALVGLSSSVFCPWPHVEESHTS